MTITTMKPSQWSYASKDCAKKWPTQIPTSGLPSQFPSSHPTPNPPSGSTHLLPSSWPNSWPSSWPSVNPTKFITLPPTDLPSTSPLTETPSFVPTNLPREGPSGTNEPSTSPSVSKQTTLPSDVPSLVLLVDEDASKPPSGWPSTVQSTFPSIPDITPLTMTSGHEGASTQESESPALASNPVVLSGTSKSGRDSTKKTSTQNWQFTTLFRHNNG